MAQNLYAVGDYVYFECFPFAPYQIRRIEELYKTPSGAVEAKVVCFYRRRDLPEAVLKVVDQQRSKILTSNQRKKSSIFGKKKRNKEQFGEQIEADPEILLLGENPEQTKTSDDGGFFDFAGLPSGANELSFEKLHELRHHELFISRKLETLPAHRIRGKCNVVCLNEIETCDMYIGREDAFFYILGYVPSSQILFAASYKGTVGIGPQHQASIPELLKSSAEIAEKSEEEDEEETKGKPPQATDREHIFYHPQHNLIDGEIDKFLNDARSVAAFSKTMDSTSGINSGTLQSTATSATSRDITMFQAMGLLHLANYDIKRASNYLIPPRDKQFIMLDGTERPTSFSSSEKNIVCIGGPILCRDQLELWSSAEATLFELALEKYGKNFDTIRNEYLPWKSLQNIVEYYYMWKAIRVSSKKADNNVINRIYIPNSSNSMSIHQTSSENQTCECCSVTESPQWFVWGPMNLQLRLCVTCWLRWKKLGVLQQPPTYTLPSLDSCGFCETMEGILEQEGRTEENFPPRNKKRRKFKTPHRKNP